MYVVRLNVQDPAALDGTSDLDLASAGVSRNDDPALGLVEVDIPSGTNFGRFDPRAVFGAPSLQYTLNIVSISVVPSASNFGSGDIVEVVSPLLPGNYRESVTIVDLETANGIDNNVLQILPVNHLLAFNTPSGVTGPWRIQCSFAPMKRVDDFLGLVPTV